MSYISIQTRAQVGLDSPRVNVDVHLANGLTCFNTESLGPTDDKDFYAFTLDNDAEVSFSLTDLNGDVDLILKSSTGRTLTYEWKLGSQDLNITELLEAN